MNAEIWKCCHCGETYDELPYYYENHGDNHSFRERTESTDCPECGWGLEEAGVCPECGEAFALDGLFHGLCAGCVMDLAEDGELFGEYLLSESGLRTEFYVVFLYDTQTDNIDLTAVCERNFKEHYAPRKQMEMRREFVEADPDSYAGFVKRRERARRGKAAV